MVFNILPRKIPFCKCVFSLLTKNPRYLRKANRKWGPSQVCISETFLHWQLHKFSFEPSTTSVHFTHIITSFHTWVGAIRILLLHMLMIQCDTKCTDMADGSIESLLKKKYTLLCETYHLGRLFLKNFDMRKDAKWFYAWLCQRMLLHIWLSLLSEFYIVQAALFP